MLNLSSRPTFFLRAVVAGLLAAHGALAGAQAPAAASAPAPAPARAASGGSMAPPAAAASAAPATATPAAPPPPASGTTAAAPADNATVRALVVADMEATISSQFAGRLTSMPKQVGDTFAAGDLLAGFDCAERQAAVKAGQAELLGARETHLAKLKLQSLGAVSDLEVTMAAAAAEKAKSQLALVQAQEKYCQVYAPYAGKVVRMRAKAFESVQLGQPLLEIVNLSSLRVQLFVPSTWVRWIKPGKPLTVAIDETGQSYTARVSKISGRIDGASQTVEVVARFDRLPASVLPGMIGRASFPEAK
ncbi:MAG TPA: efflux RND transporter periplasmic adaptor subunit [Ramlibacter sp.]|jgi:RND family efflux transporter MFP subunit|uniref:efflux RND transporter periplasmic adaptor subunit n=1 Tax=Ramlibacter sp. TaxID=1917967 RepID=UPI002D6DE823|nr:efflux RND transporter periplasmic adaptor subunit [Ramlibacter sp.]HZY19741.1 efflux RND transporter periplasmic adaptor subunit [Ramlibacter sp.]